MGPKHSLLWQVFCCFRGGKKKKKGKRKKNPNQTRNDVEKAKS